METVQDQVQASKKVINRKSITATASQELRLRTYRFDDLKLILFLALATRFEERKQQLLRQNQKQVDLNLMRIGSHFNRTSSTIVIEPIKKQVLELRRVSAFLKVMTKQIQQKLIVRYKIVIAERKSHKPLQLISQHQINPLSMYVSYSSCNVSPHMTPQNESEQSNKVGNYMESPLLRSLEERNKENQGNSIDSNWKEEMKVRDSIKRSRFFILRKKQELSFLNKIAVNFSSGESEFKALVETMQIFLKNLSRSNHYLKIIEQSITKHHKIMVYLKELLKVFSNIIAIFKDLSTKNRGLQIKDNQAPHKIETSFLLPEVEQYYEKSNQTINIMRHFSLSPIFASFMSHQKEKCHQLIHLFIEARYVLRYLEKQIENLEPRKNNQAGKNLPKWQKAFRSKFLPKNIF